MIFVSLELEDETGPVQVIAWRSLKVAQRQESLNSRLLAVKGILQPTHLRTEMAVDHRPVI